MQYDIYDYDEYESVVGLQGVVGGQSPVPAPQTDQHTANQHHRHSHNNQGAVAFAVLVDLTPKSSQLNRMVVHHFPALLVLSLDPDVLCLLAHILSEGDPVVVAELWGVDRVGFCPIEDCMVF